VRAQRASKGDGPGGATFFEGHLRWPPQDDDSERCAALVDALRQRLGPDRVRRFAACASHLPERAEALPSIDGETLHSPPPERGRSASAASRVGVSIRNTNTDPSPDRVPRHSRCEASASLKTAAEGRRCPPLSGEGSIWPEPEAARPLLLLPRAEPAEVTALIPDGPPRRFCWRGVTYDVAGAEGPERIGAEWWREPPPTPPPQAGEDSLLFPPPQAGEGQGGGLTRDYYLVEDDIGRRFWLYREGLYGRETAAARWFVQGLFA